MFVQVIQGSVSDREQVRAAIERWVEELAPGAQGWLGTTAGVTDDGQFVALARFDSEAAARRNSDRPEQGEWWAETSKCFNGEATFSDSRNVDVDLNGNPDDAGFVQIMQGRGSNPDRARELMSGHEQEWAEFRPDIIGSLTIEHDEGAYTMAMYFTSEEEARQGERKEPPPELQAQMDEMSSLMTAPPRFFDLPDAWLFAPR